MNQEDRKVLEERNAVFSRICTLGACRNAKIVAETVSGWNPDTREMEERASFHICVEDIMGFNVTAPQFESMDEAFVFLVGYLAGRMDGIKSLKIYSDMTKGCNADDNNAEG